MTTFTASELSTIEAEAKDCGFPNTESFIKIQAGQWRLAILSNVDHFAKVMPNCQERQAFAGKLEGENLPHKQFKAPKAEYSYLLFDDGSLYLDSNGGDEVWALAEDFADEKLMKIKVDVLGRAERRLMRKIGGLYKERAKMPKAKKRLMACLAEFVKSDDFTNGVVSATRAAYSGGGYSVELFRDGRWRVLDNGQIGNLYESPGIIIGLPTYESAAYGEEHENIIDALHSDDDAITRMQEEVESHFDF